jgi:predicted RNase H-like nuclease
VATTLIGIDCAVQAQNIGLARALFEEGKTHLEQVLLGSQVVSIAEIVAGWLAVSRGALLVLDAPLGWPDALGSALHVHQAGLPIQGEPNDLFRRYTDRFVRGMTGKQPLDVGADRIARTAQAALKLLEEIRVLTGKPIPLAWQAGVSAGVQAIEVYPAATLIVHGMQMRGYKLKDGHDARKQIIRKLGKQIDLPAETALLEDSADALDAVVCLLAGVDFLRGEVYPPRDLALVRKEGWIWVRKSG